ncbi:contractile injection system tape measure protein [Pseudoalteromonas sp. S16_S37]|uniref:contractile injection system tape measure protein n=1 Tax=Pseudoalteromonas sp. S16_S37 TaxID=2720228 RepID=UPI001681518F|nr:contractile injection system tape measure protein [Pseudoalteromonas sp. S16_S37]MBD1583102.1 hypothetical protein [Pseudoalteromonas sp. S16_S37]
MKLVIKQIGAQIQAPKSTLQATNTSLADLETQFAQWIMRGLSQMDWSEFESYESAIDTLKLPDIDIDLAQIDWQQVQRDPYSAFKTYLYPQLKQVLEKQLAQAKQAHKAQSQYSVSDALKRQGRAHLTLEVQRLLANLLAEQSPTVMAKATLRLELKRQITEAFKKQQNALIALQNLPNWPMLRVQLVNLFRHESGVLFELLAPLYPSHTHTRLNKLLALLSVPHLTHFISWLELTASSDKSVQNTPEKYQHRTLLLSVYEHFFIRKSFDEQLLQQVCLALTWPNHRQAISMWCAVELAQSTPSNVAHLKRIVRQAAAQSDLAIELVNKAAHSTSNRSLISASTSQLPVFGQNHDIEKPSTNNTKRALLRTTLTQIMSLLRLLSSDNTLPNQQVKSWMTLQTIRAGQTLLTAQLTNQLTQLSKALSRCWQARTPEAILAQVDALLSTIRAQQAKNSPYTVSQFSLLKLYYLLSQLSDVPAVLLQVSADTQNTQTFTEQQVSSWLDKVSTWCARQNAQQNARQNARLNARLNARQQQALQDKSHPMFAAGIAPRDLVGVLTALKKQLAEQQKAALLPHQHSALQGCVLGIQALLKSLPIQAYSNTWLRIHSIEHWTELDRVLDNLLAHCEQQKNNPEVDSQAKAITLNERQIEHTFSLQITTLYDQLVLRLQDMLQQFASQALTSSSSITQSERAPFVQCAQRAAQIAIFAQTLHNNYSGGIGRLFAFVSTQKMCFIHELSQLPAGEALQGTQGLTLRKLLVEQIQALQAISKQITQTVPHIARSYSSPDAWLMPLIDVACEQVSVESSTVLSSLSAYKHAQLNEQVSDNVTVLQLASLPAELVSLHGKGAAKPNAYVSQQRENLSHEFTDKRLVTEAVNSQSIALQNASELPKQIEGKPELAQDLARHNVVEQRVALDDEAEHTQAKQPHLQQQGNSEHHVTTLLKPQVNQQPETALETHLAVNLGEPLPTQVLACEKNGGTNKVHGTLAPQQAERTGVNAQPNTLLQALMNVQNSAQAHQLLAEIEKNIATEKQAAMTADEQTQLQNAMSQSRSRLQKLRKTTLVKADKNLIHKTMAQVKAQLEQLQQQSEQAASPITFDVGLVILWPFLPTLFNKLSLLHSDEHEHRGLFINDQAHRQAHAVLCYIANIDPLIEVSHTANALLGLPLDMEIDDVIELDDKTIAAVDYMLHALVSRWEILKGMPVDEFVRLFIVREGQVEQTDTGYHISAETMPQDVLMAKLPWGLGMVQLPWLEQTLLHIEWKYGF